MQCREVRDVADSFLSEQLLVETNHELLRHLETCPNCRAEIAARREMRNSLRSAFVNAAELGPRPEFAEELRAKLQASQPQISRRSLLQSWWAVAAGMVVAAGGGVFVRNRSSRSRLTALAREAAGDHQNCAVTFNLAERPIPMETAGRLYGAPYTALATFEANTADGPLQIVERHSCVYEGRRFAHVVFRHHEALTSLLITDGPPPASPQLEPIGLGPAVASLPAGRYLAFVVADLDREDVLTLARALVDPLSRRLV